MKKLKIVRFRDGVDFTIGKFYLTDNNKTLLSGFSCEPSGSDEIRANLDKRIPQGLYNAKWSFSPKFNRFLPVLFNTEVSEDRRILIHIGNTGNDTKGCILLGFDDGVNRVLNSRKCFLKFCEILGREDFLVEIVNGNLSK